MSRLDCRGWTVAAGLLESNWLRTYTDDDDDDDTYVIVVMMMMVVIKVKMIRTYSVNRLMMMLAFGRFLVR